MILPLEDGGVRHFGAMSADNAQYAAAVARSIVMDVMSHTKFMGDPKSIVVTGGFAKRPVAQVIADASQVPVEISPEVNRVVLGGLILGVSQCTGETIQQVAARLCPATERVENDPARAAFYYAFGGNYVRNLESLQA